MDNIHVSIRLRPLNERERTQGQYHAWLVKPEDQAIFPLGPDQRPISGATGYAFGRKSPAMSYSPIAA